VGHSMRCVLCGEPPGQDSPRVLRRPGRVRRRPSVPEVLTGILVFFRGSGEWFGSRRMATGGNWIRACLRKRPDWTLFD